MSSLKFQRFVALAESWIIAKLARWAPHRYSCATRGEGHDVEARRGTFAVSIHCLTVFIIPTVPLALTLTLSLSVTLSQQCYVHITSMAISNCSVSRVVFFVAPTSPSACWPSLFILRHFSIAHAETSLEHERHITPTPFGTCTGLMLVVMDSTHSGRCVTVWACPRDPRGSTVWPHSCVVGMARPPSLPTPRVSEYQSWMRKEGVS